MGLNTIRALFDKHTITVYQAYNKNIAQLAVNSQTFVSPPFKKERMTWIKPSFLWMMYRSGWATKENQEHILAIKIKRAGFEWALANACLSHFDSKLYSSYEEWKNLLSRLPVRVQWDPERDLKFNSLNYRTIQIGLSGIAVDLYITNWITEITDISDLCIKTKQVLIDGKISQAMDMLPKEETYPLPDTIADKIR
ncbi:DUF4291 domain-containing protein [Deminuibacter soli]|uniref:DUF4291 domain-containing protein n=1 Tax=Deminuibacter soli TaxID=2291815 RepID=A0A3E1NCA2_9BACT|nr:DUF4291 domain-containing protein [Deminuibacter soli]RFM25560.1 DUF4291 domain-containing protein [Deminuibacter soli]